MNLSETKIYNFFDQDKNIDLLAKDIFNLFYKKASSKTIEYNFDIKKGTGQIKEKKANTFFYCDIESNTTLFNFKKLLFNIDLKDITKEEDDILVRDTNEFLNKVKDRIIEAYCDKIREKIREVVLPESKTENIPLTVIQIMDMHVMDYSSIPESAKHLVMIGVHNDQEINNEERNKAIAYVQNKQEETGEDVETIFEIEKKMNNPLLEKIVSMKQKEKYLYELHVNFFVDYSLSKIPQIGKPFG